MASLDCIIYVYVFCNLCVSKHTTIFKEHLSFAAAIADQVHVKSIKFLM